MIGSLSGVLTEKRPPHLLVDVQGVGYEVQVPMSTFYLLPEVGNKIRLLTHFAVREDAQILYGFMSADERLLFRSLIRVNGVGGRTALAILSGISVTGFIAAVEREDLSGLLKVPGIGKKTAERLLVEMRDRLKDWPSFLAKTAVVGGGVLEPPQEEAYHALLSLGYKPKEVSRLLRLTQANASTEEIIRAALQQVSPNSPEMELGQ